MGRYKVSMERIKNDKKRKLTYQTRKKGIIKKALELTKLCDVNVAMIICPNDHDQEPIIFPPDDPHKFNNLIGLYRQNRITNPGKIRYYSMSDYFKEKTIKVEEELAQVKKKHLEAKYSTWFDFLNDYKEVELRELAAILETKIHHLKTKLNNNNNNSSKIQINQDHINTITYPYPADNVDLSFDPEEVLLDMENNDTLDVDVGKEEEELLSGDENNNPCPQDDVDQLIKELLGDKYNHHSRDDQDELLEELLDDDYNNSSASPDTKGNFFSPDLPPLIDQEELLSSDGNNNPCSRDDTHFFFDMERLLGDGNNDINSLFLK